MKLKSRSLFIVGHGSSLSKGAENAARAHAETLRKSGVYEKVLVHFLIGEQPLPSIPDGEVFVFPFFMTGGGTVEARLSKLLPLGQTEEAGSNSHIYQCDALGMSKTLVHILKKMTEEVCDQYSYGSSAVQVVLFAHGSGKTDASFQTTKMQEDRLREITDFESITSVFLEQEPYIQDWLDENAFGNGPTIILGVFAADGPHSAVDVPSAISEWEQKIRLERQVDVLPIHYAGAVGARPEIVELIQQSVADRIKLS
ncbi:MAG: CbiX/SirB N-terminal domain-containing protein [Sneathiella sp.]